MRYIPHHPPPTNWEKKSSKTQSFTHRFHITVVMMMMKSIKQLHSPEVGLVDGAVSLKSLWIQENKLCQEQIINGGTRVRQMESISDCPHS